MTNDEKIYKAHLAEMGCMACWMIYGHEDVPAQLHHYRSGGWGKGDYTTLIPLCPEHHTGRMGIHGMGTKAFDRYYQKNYGFDQTKLLDMTHTAMAQILNAWRKAI